MESNPYDSPSSTLRESKDWNGGNTPADAMYLAIAFVLFSFGVILPLIYGVGKPFFEGVGMSLPRFTSFLMHVPPWTMMGVSVLVSVGLYVIHLQMNSKKFRLIAWTVIGVTAVIMLVGVLAFLSPLFSVVSAL